jgi:ribonucleoside-diphosphate reductase alpha chain
MNYYELNIDYSRDSLITEQGLKKLKANYMLPNEKSPQDAFVRAATAFADDQEHAQRIYDYASKQWFMFSTPILSNGGTKRGLGISCYLNQVEDSIEGISENYKEDMYLSRFGGGIGTDFSKLRSNGESTSSGNITTGIIPFIKVVDSLMLATQQGITRRGAAAIYLDISHPEVEEFIEIRRETKGEDRRALFLHHALNIPDTFMNAVQEDLDWDLVDPNSKKVKKIIRARELWVTILKTRMETGEPYLHFIDTSNKALPYALKVRGQRINCSNLCNEIYLPTAPDRSAVCCLSSVNLEKYLEWKDNDLFIEDLVRFLDNVLTHFIENAPAEMWRAVNSARRERSLGLGAMGFHSFLQSMSIPFESLVAASWNQKMFAHIYNHAKAASGKLAEERGEAPDMRGTGYRNAHLLAVAPNASSSIICGNTSPSIEPFSSNGFVSKTDVGSTIIKNKYLEKLLEEKGKNNDEVWYDIITNGGSVLHLPFLNEEEKEVFKTAFELDQAWVVEHASIRQKFICQGQSVNLFFMPTVPFGKLHEVHKKAWQGGLKGLYYCRSFKEKRAETGGLTIQKKEIKEEAEDDFKEKDNSCLMCEG